LSDRSLDSPLFLVGMPRSGTTILFEVLAAREDLAWFSGHLQRSPGRPALAALSRLADLTPRMRRAVSRSDQARPALERLRVGPVEAYPLWQRCCGERFRYDYLLGARATPAERGCMRATVNAVLRYHGKPRFAAKITGPARIGYLTSIFPEARFVHVVRDGRAVVQSLMKVEFWQARDRMTTPAWENGLGEADLADWERYDRAPLALAAVQWRRVVEAAREEARDLAPDRYAEVRYERFVADPHAVLDDIAAFCGLAPSPRAARFLDSRFDLRDMNYQWRTRLDDEQIGMLNDLMGATLAAFGYALDPPGVREEAETLATPFRSVTGS
jgi:omega-hydroxy-beta-dihydromenaquinone-9 sulfotransferase